MLSRDPMLSREKRVAIFAAAFVAALLLLLWRRQGAEPPWRLAVEASQGEAKPWSSVRLEARIDPRAVLQKPETKWKWSWKADGTTFSNEPFAVDWRSGTPGDHELTVIVESPWGTRKSATLHVPIELHAFASPLGRVADPSPFAPVPRKVPLPFGIADVWIEKDHVCQGEPSRIRVTPFDDRGEKQWLVPMINGQQAWEAPFIVPLMPPGLQPVPISVADPRVKGGLVNTYAFIEVDDCVAPFPIYVEHRPIAPEEDNVAFHVRVLKGPDWKAWDTSGVDSPPPVADAASYRWTFGDGANETTHEPRVDHRYPPESQRGDGRFASFAVRVEVLDASGQAMGVGYDGVLLANRLQTLKKEHGVVQLVTRQAPESPNADGERSLEVTLKNIDPSESARLEAMVLHLVPCSGKDPVDRPATLADTFDDTVIPPRGSITGHFRAPRLDPGDDVCWVRAQVSGVSQPGGLVVKGSFSLDTGRAQAAIHRKTREEALAMVSAQGPEKSEAMAKAMDLLGHPQSFSDADLRRLESEGKIPRGVLTRDPFAAH